MITLKLKKLRDLREDHDLTQEQIAHHLNISQRLYSYYENGKRNIPIETLIQIAELYDVSLDYLTGRSSSKK